LYGLLFAFIIADFGLSFNLFFSPAGVPLLVFPPPKGYNGDRRIPSSILDYE